ncbi:pre-mRNA-splicing factor RBM22 [Cyclospora cayetanensis]|uniref:Pre-mRNA-splicing factor RBM22 n=1 Tax=Cyclospora cayetanensis TaxID=88456 RepID=A0A6P6RZP8_9EIME|nr:pre-mRNA-splicing factor RBM22 [Cyclospora cayetanensis]
MHSQGKSGFGVAHDFKGSLKEEADFPILCETCLGENPYVRMQRDRNGKECHICTRAYTGFRWKPGPKARYKCTVVCQQCARLKNVCQTCLFDLEYGLPVQVRDRIMGESRVSLPEHPVNREYLNSRMGGQTEDLPYGKSEEIDQRLRRIARTTPYYRRNLPRVCSFWRKGECTRGDECPYLHQELYTDPALATQNMRDRYVGQDDPVAEKIFRLASTRSQEETAPPADESITTIFVGGVLEAVRESDLMERLYGYGEILAIRMNPQKKMAFVCFAERAGAVAAMKQLAGTLTINGVTMRVAWAKPKPKPSVAGAEGSAAAGSSSGSGSATTTSGTPMPAPEGYLASPVPGLPPVPLLPGMPAPPPAVMGGSVPYRSMMPSEAELSRK